MASRSAPIRPPVEHAARVGLRSSTGGFTDSIVTSRRHGDDMRRNAIETSTTLAVEAIGPGRWAADLVRPDAAALVGLGINAVLGDLGERRVLAVTIHFVLPATPGRVEITVGHIDRTAARTTSDARIRQTGRVLARLLLTTANDLGHPSAKETP